MLFMHKWIDDLFDDIDELITESKQVKFNTHKNRRVLMGKIKNMVIEAVNENTISKKPANVTTAAITRPNPNKQAGFAVMTEGLASRADEVHSGNPVPPMPDQSSFRKSY